MPAKTATASKPTHTPTLTALTGGTAIALVAIALASAAGADTVDYAIDGTDYQGYIAMPEGEALGTVLIVHDWDGVNDHEIARADALAEAGYVGVAIDLYGTDAVLEGMDDYRRETGALYADRTEFRTRLAGSIAAVAAMEGVPQNMVITGYCFGGAAVLEAARAGMDLDGFVSFHGGLGTPDGQGYADTTAPVLVLHGSADPVSGMGDLAALMDELQAAGVTHGAEIYGGARHSFTVEGSNDWDPAANAKAEAALMNFLDTNL
ncbi:dienelactone hydrolase family protein [Roseicitreum antarcticum]|uniref:Dienelactone hydrolase n=1 Tax=Roseicitreum antarcticum TaxID=564137 RepID=A0A1H2RMQ3_9RHOB|nr:dienelactone hydrolase family protein [Roseicitreum antarcticum]SDW20044.1 Dienelactone hydrolase [Roseicitreum antarcticum]